MKRNLKYFLGPQPILPIYISLAGFLATTYGQARFKPRTNLPFFIWLESIPAGIITGLALYISASAVVLLQKRFYKIFKATPWHYILVAVISSAYTFSQSMIEPTLYNQVPKFLDLFSRTYIRDYFPIFFAVNVSGFLYQELHKAIDQKRKALKLVQAQRSTLIQAEERSRQNLASFLHDRVQASLVTVSMQITEITKGLPKLEAEKLNSIIAELEHIRRVEVRSAAQQLSPDLSVIGLASALRSYTQTLKPAVETIVSFAPSAEPWLAQTPENSVAQLGVFRMAQQVTLNAAVHGRAENIEIRFSVELQKGKNYLKISIENDGQAITKNYKPGTGSAIIDGWTSILGGHSELANQPNGKVAFTFSMQLR